MKISIIHMWCFFIASFLQFNYLYSQCNPPSYNDPQNQTHYDAMNIPCAWTLTNGSSDIIVGTFDRYFDNAHPDLVGKVVDIIGDCDFSGAINSHYTHGNQSLGAIAGIRDNNVCVAGSGGDTKVIGYCGYATNSSIDQLVSHGADIISVSAWGGISKSTIEELTFNGVPIVLAGLCNYHQATNPDGYHSVPGAIHVGRTFLDGTYWPYHFNCDSSIPNENRDVLVMTDYMYRIGEAASCELSGGGTSLGTPVLAGVVALMKSVNSCLTPGDIEEILVQTSAPSNTSSSRGGLINAYEAVLMAQTFDKMDREWAGTKSYDYYEVSGDLNVSAGSDITINKGFRLGAGSTMHINSGAVVRFEEGSMGYFGDLSKIIVKRGGHLILNGATFTTGGCGGATQWAGIKIEGNSSQNQQLPSSTLSGNGNGVVEILNNSIIENAKTAVSMDAHHIGWPEIQQYRGGLVIASNSTFRNNDRAFEFMEYRFRDNSRISRCFFDEHIQVATHWANNGVTYEQSTFQNYSKTAIYTYDAQVYIVDANTFDSDGHTEYDQAAVDFYHTYPNVFANGSEVGDYGSYPNQFIGGFHGVFCEGCASGEETRIVNNQFLGLEYGVTMQGSGNHAIMDNDFIANLYGVLIADNGSFGNIMSNNAFSSNVISSSIYRENSGFQFLDNCFDFSSSGDVKLHDANLSDDIGSPEIAAGNVFSYAGYYNAIRATGNTIPSNYHMLTDLEQNQSSSRLVPRVYDNKVFDSDNMNASQCGSWFTPGPIVVRPFGCKLPSTCEDLLTYIENIENEIDTLEVDLNDIETGTTEWYTTRIRISGLKRCLQKAKIKYIALCGRDDEGEGRIMDMFADDDFIYKTYVLGLLIQKGKYVEAQEYISLLEPGSEDEIDFVTTQNINISRLMDGTLELTNSELNTLFSIGNKSNPYSSFARSLYKMCTGEKIQIDLSQDDENGSSSARTSIESKSFTISPNPFSSNLQIDFEGFDNEVTIQITSMVGQLIESKTIDPLKDGTYTWSPSGNIQSGLYLITIISKDYTETEKVIYQGME